MRQAAVMSILVAAGAVSASTHSAGADFQQRSQPEQTYGDIRRRQQNKGLRRLPRAE